MKKNFLILGIILSILAFITSCDKWIDHEINKDPDNPTDVPINMLMASGQGQLVYAAGGMDMTGITSMWAQHLAGTGRQAYNIGKLYVMTDADATNLWNNLYPGVMMDIKIIIDKSYEKGKESPYNRGIARVLMAYSLGISTDVWGAIPYSEAFQGQKNLKPKYDSQEEIYKSIQTLLDSAIVNLSVPAESNLIPVNGDMIFGGKVNKWIKTAYALKARYALHLSKVNGNSAYTTALGYLDKAIGSNAEDCQFNCGEGAAESNPLFQFARDRSGDLSVSEEFIASLGKDPRKTVFEPTSDNTYGGYFGVATAPIHLITYAEVLFIKAEAQCKTNAEADAKQTLKDAINASLSKFSVTGGTWMDSVSTRINTLSGDNLYKEIMMQKYVAMFMQTESFVDCRRTGIPELKPVTGDKVPRCYPYQTEEKLNNSNCPARTSIFEKVWWDK